ncbi:unnamed protein product, partial [Meganyctiphanes norvegica]
HRSSDEAQYEDGPGADNPADFPQRPQSNCSWLMEGGTSERETQSSPQTTTAGRVLGSMAPAVATAVGTPQYHQLDSPILTVQKELKAMKEKASKDYTHILQNQSIIKD